MTYYGKISNQRQKVPTMPIRLTAVSLLLLLAGCSKLNQENYRKLKVGLTYDQVVAILGKPDSCSDALFVKSCIWGSEAKNISVNFMGDKVLITTSKNIH